MSQPTADTAETTAEQTDAGTGRSRLWLSSPGEVSVHTALGGVALAPVAATTVLRILRNAPVTLPEWLGAAFPAIATLAAVVPALALAGLGASVDRRAERVALLAAGVFPLLAVVGDPAWFPAAAALVTGGSGAVAFSLRDSGFQPGPTAIAVLGTAALCCSIAGAAGFAAVTLGSVGAGIAFVGLAGLPFVRSLDTPGFVCWVLATVVVTWLVASAPFVAGAVTLVAFAAGDIPAILLAAGVAGGLVVALAGLWNHRWGVAVGALLLLAAGAPATLARGTAVVLGLVVLVETWGGDARA